MAEELECPRCHQPSSGTARRRGHCTACGAALASDRALKEAAVRSYLYGPTLPSRELSSSYSSRNPSPS